MGFDFGGRIPELLFGIHMGAPFFYYIVAVLVTTPVVLLLLTLIGMKVSFDNRKKWVYPVLLIWFFAPFLMSFFHIRQHMVRYIIEFYAPLSLLCAIGFEYISSEYLKKSWKRYVLAIPLFLYLFIILVKITPFYMDYFNELVGGTKTVYEKKLFFLGWWGEGLKDGGNYVISHAKKNDAIGLAINPNNNVLPKRDDVHYENFNEKKRYAYVLVNTFMVTRIGFDEAVLQKEYNLVYTVVADGAEFVHVYKHK